MRRVGVVDGAREEENTLVVDLVVLQVQDLQRRHLPVRDQRGELHQTARLEAILYALCGIDSTTVEEELADRRLVSRDQIVHVRGELDEEVVVQAQIYTSRGEPNATGKHQRVGGEEQCAELHLLEDLLLLRRQTTPYPSHSLSRPTKHLQAQQLHLRQVAERVEKRGGSLLADVVAV